MSVVAFVIFMGGAWLMLSLINNRNTTKAEMRLERIGRPKSLAEIDLAGGKANDDRFGALKATMSNLGAALEPQSDLEKNSLKIKLANAGFRSESAAAVYHGLRMLSLLAFTAPAVMIFGLKYGVTMKAAQF